jgi:hypothetical protein
MTLFLGAAANLTDFLDSLPPEEKAAILELYRDSWGGLSQAWVEVLEAGVIVFLAVTHHRFSWAIEAVAAFVLSNV